MRDRCPCALQPPPNPWGTRLPVHLTVTCGLCACSPRLGCQGPKTKARKETSEVPASVGVPF